MGSKFAMVLIAVLIFLGSVFFGSRIQTVHTITQSLSPANKQSSTDGDFYSIDRNKILRIARQMNVEIANTSIVLDKKPIKSNYSVIKDSDQGDILLGARALANRSDLQIEIYISPVYKTIPKNDQALLDRSEVEINKFLLMSIAMVMANPDPLSEKIQQDGYSLSQKENRFFVLKL